MSSEAILAAIRAACEQFAYWRWSAADWFFKNRMMSARARGDGASTVRWLDAYARLRARR